MVKTICKNENRGTNVVKEILSFSAITLHFLLLLFFFFFFVFLGLHWRHIEIPRLGGRIGAVAAGLYHSHSNSESKPHV